MLLHFHPSRPKFPAVSPAIVSAKALPSHFRTVHQRVAVSIYLVSSIYYSLCCLHPLQLVVQPTLQVTLG